MKKSLAIISALILVLSVSLTACGKKNIFTDGNGKSHVAVNEKGSTKQDEFGNLYEVIEENGTTRTQIHEFPSAMTNKSQSWIENGVLRMKVPKGWKTSGITTQTVLYHSGRCTETGNSHCQIEFKYNNMKTVDELKEKYLEPVRWLVERSGECSDLKEYETELLGLKAKAVSYKFDKTDITCYCYFVQQAIPVIQIEVYAYKDCFSEEAVIELLNKNCTLKDLGGEIPTTTTTTEATEEPTASQAK